MDSNAKFKDQNPKMDSFLQQIQGTEIECDPF
jgi:hypothetical protein